MNTVKSDLVVGLIVVAPIIVWWLCFSWVDRSLWRSWIAEHPMKQPSDSKPDYDSKNKASDEMGIEIEGNTSRYCNDSKKDRQTNLEIISIPFTDQVVLPFLARRIMGILSKVGVKINSDHQMSKESDDND